MKCRCFLYRAKYIYSPWLSLKSPVDVSLELSSHCNMRCSYCYHADQNNLPFKTKGFMSCETAEKILSECAREKVNSIKFTWKGEQTLNPEFYKIAAFAKSLASGSILMDRVINTNFKFHTDRYDIFNGLNCMTKVKVSFDSFRPEVFEQRDQGFHALILKNIDTFYGMKDKNVKLVIQAVRTKLNADEPLWSEISHRWPDAEISIREMVTGRNKKDLDTLANVSRDCSNKRQVCRQAFARLIFNHEGNAHPCCPDIGEKLCLGNIHEQSISEIWNGEKALRLRSALKSGKAFEFEPCRSCSSFESYKGYRPSWSS